VTMDSLVAAVREDEWLMARYEAGREQEAGGYDRRTRALIVDDEPDIVRLIAPLLEREGIEVSVATTGSQALEVARAVMPDLVILDLTLPRLDGVEVCRELRQFSDAYVIMVTARDDETDLLVGLAVGADDYLTKPFSFAELLARLRALARRTPQERPTVLTVGDLRLDPAGRRVWRGEAELELSPKEFALLEVFMRRPGQTLSRLDLIERAWDLAYEQRSNVVDVYVRYLREKVDRPFGRHSIETVRGAGYRLREDA